MVTCENCKLWFHKQCVCLPNIAQTVPECVRTKESSRRTIVKKEYLQPTSSIEKNNAKFITFGLFVCLDRIKNTGKNFFDSYKSNKIA